VASFPALANDYGSVRAARKLVEEGGARRRNVVPAPAQARPIAPERQGKEYLALAGRIDPQDAKERCALLVTIDRGCRWSPEATMRLRYVRRIGRNRRDMLAVVMLFGNSRNGHTLRIGQRREFVEGVIHCAALPFRVRASA
jgi:hypothetical protein